MPIGIVKQGERGLIVALEDKKSEYYKTQQNLAIPPGAIEKHKLKKGDRIRFYYGRPYDYIKINLKLTPNSKTIN